MIEVPRISDVDDEHGSWRGDKMLSSFGTFLRNPEVTPEQLHTALPDLTTVLVSAAKGEYSRWTQTATVKDLVHSFLKTTARCIIADPTLVHPCYQMYVALQAAPREVEATWHEHYRTLTAKFIDDTADEAKLLANYKYAFKQGFSSDEVEAVCRLVSPLTEHGIINDGFWYRHAVRKLRGPATFGFLEGLHRKLDQTEGTYLPEGGRHAEYYRDAYRLVLNVVDGMSYEQDRNQQNAQVVSQLLRKELYFEVPTQNAVIQAANKISELINKAKLIKDEEGNPVTIGSLDEHKFSDLPAALGRLLYITRDFSADEGIAEKQAYQDGVCVEVLSWIVSMASERHEAWYINRVLHSAGDLRMMTPRLKQAELDELRSIGGRNRPSYWKKWQAGYGKLT